MNKKQKNILLILGFLLALIICYSFALKNTIEQKKRFETLSHESLMFENAPKQLSLLRQKNIYYDSLLTKYQLDGSSIQNNLLKIINEFADSNGLEVINFIEPHLINKDDIVVKSYKFVLKGEYNAINKLIYILEQKTKFGEITNLHFQKKKNFRTGKFYLQAHVLLKSFE